MTDEEELHHWVTQECQAAGCRVLIRLPLGAQEPTPICKWHKQGKAYNDDQIQSAFDAGPPVSFDEFQSDLFHAIRAASGRVQALNTAHLLVKKQKFRMAQSYVDCAEGLAKKLIELLGKGMILPEDIRRVLAMDARALVPPIIHQPWNQPQTEQNGARLNDPTQRGIQAPLLPNPALND